MSEELFGSLGVLWQCEHCQRVEVTGLDDEPTGWLVDDDADLFLCETCRTPAAGEVAGLIEVLAAHELNPSTALCSCGSHQDFSLPFEHRAHLADALAQKLADPGVSCQ